MEALRIGDVARAAGVSVDAVRFYERRGVLPAPMRRASGYRQYTEATVERIRFAKSLQALGFRLDEVADVLAAVDAGIATCASEQPRVDAVLARIDEKMAELGAIRRGLLATLRRCRDGKCALLENAPRQPNAGSRGRNRAGRPTRAVYGERP